LNFGFLASSGSRSGQPFVDQNRHFDAAVLFAAVARGVVGHGLGPPNPNGVTIRKRRDFVILGKVPFHGVSAALAERAIFASVPSADA